ncbi:Gx transporter family protein [Pseudothermotoga sp.]|uniref:Gx transporter family protein n=1 Tax=Pseudothermotoga sp. TaxID=2033661 RepID=UPI0031F72267
MKSQKLALISSLASFGAVVYFLETFIPFPLPFGRWGLSNLVVLIAVTLFDWGTVLMVALLKSVLGSLITGRLFSVISLMSIAGSTASALVEVLVYRTFIFGLVGVSIVGSVVNNITQSIIGALLIKSWTFLVVLPQMLIFGVPGAILNAYLTERVVRRAKNSFGFDITKKNTNTENDGERV